MVKRKLEASDAKAAIRKVIEALEDMTPLSCRKTQPKEHSARRNAGSRIGGAMTMLGLGLGIALARGLTGEL